MKILNVSESDSIGGAAIAASRLNILLLSFGIDSKLLVNRKKSNNLGLIVPTSFFDKIYAKVLPHFIIKYNKWRFGTTCLTTYKDISADFFLKSIGRQKFDILHLHWVNNWFVGLSDLKKVKQPIVWTLHDNWLFTSACHSTQGCEEFMISCNNCPKVNSLNYQYNLSNQFFIKFHLLQSLKKNIYIVVPSKWMLENAIKSKLLSGFNIKMIPNFIDVNLFLPLNKDISKQKQNLEQKKKYILFGANDPLNDHNKGFRFIQQMSSRGALDGFTLIIFGRVDINVTIDIPFILKGAISDNNDLVQLYNSVELVIMPSIHESFGQIAAESMACGIPVLCFNTTGLKDIVDHKINGYLAELYNVDDLIFGFNWILSNNLFRDLIRKKIVSNFSKEYVFKQFYSLYDDILKLKKA
jgi:glycosyltransferase involved in cell wall biosynthesis